MDAATFKRLLIDRKIAVVHFSHHAVMGHLVAFPDDLTHAINNHLHETRSCCALVPGHQMGLPGSVGVIFEPDLDHIISVLYDDSGSSDYGGAELSGGRAPTETSVLESLDVPVGRYNEWRLRGAKPMGIFVADPKNVLVKKVCQIAVPDCEPFDDIACTVVTFSSVVAAFPSYKVYTMTITGLVELCSSCA